MNLPSKATSNIDYLDSLKLIMCYLVMLLHFTLAFFPAGFIGYGSKYPLAERYQAFMDALPLSLFTNTSFSLFTFFVLIAMFPTIAFYKAKAPYEVLQRQAIKRYFRFLLPVGVAILATHYLHIGGFLDFQSMAELNNSSWCAAIEPVVMPLPALLWHSFVQCYFENCGQVLTVIWCMYIIFLGSMLTLALLALFGNSRFRLPLYVASVPLLISYPTYASFIFGIACGDFYVHYLDKISLKSEQKNILGLVLIVLGIFIAILPDVILPKYITTFYTCSLGAALLVLGVLLSTWLQRILSRPFLVQQAKYTFSVLLVQIWVLFSMSLPLYCFFMSITASPQQSFVLCFAICVVITQLLAIAFYHLFEKPSQSLAEYVYHRWGD
ncbi:MAG: hypothetical protein ACI3XC_05320 [Phascolarctobacterium sp.]